MARNRLLIVLLVLAHVVVDMVIWRMAEKQPVGSPAQIALIALMRTQLSLLALFLVLRTAHWIWRLLAFVGVVGGWSGAFFLYQYAMLGFAPTTTLFTVLTLPLVLIGLVARSKGLLWGEWPHVSGSGALSANQFSLGAAFRWLTLTAVLMGLAKLAKFPESYWDVWFRVSLINTMMVIALLWSLLAMRWKVFQLCLLLLVSFVMTILCQDNPAHGWITKFLLQAGLMFGTLEICAMAGWPLERKVPAEHVPGFQGEPSVKLSS